MTELIVRFNIEDIITIISTCISILIALFGINAINNGTYVEWSIVSAGILATLVAIILTIGHAFNRFSFRTLFDIVLFAAFAVAFLMYFVSASSVKTLFDANVQGQVGIVFGVLVFIFFVVMLPLSYLGQDVRTRVKPITESLALGLNSGACLSLASIVGVNLYFKLESQSTMNISTADILLYITTGVLVLLVLLQSCVYFMETFCLGYARIGMANFVVLGLMIANTVYNSNAYTSPLLISNVIVTFSGLTMIIVTIRHRMQAIELVQYESRMTFGEPSNDIYDFKV